MCLHMEIWLEFANLLLVMGYMFSLCMEIWLAFSTVIAYGIYVLFVHENVVGIFLCHCS